MMRWAMMSVAVIAASAANAAPPLSGTLDLGQPFKPPSGPIGKPNIPPLMLDTQASFDFANVPTGDYKLPAVPDPAAQQLLVPKPSYVMIFPIIGAPQRHALHIYGITLIDPEPISFLSRPFDVAKRKTLTVAWDGQFFVGDTIRVLIGIEGVPDLAALAFRDGQISLVSPMGYQAFTTYKGATIQGNSQTPSEHRFVVSCGAISHTCTVSFTQQGQTVISQPFTYATPTLMPTPPGPRRVYLRITWPKNEASSVHNYDVRRLTISGDAPGTP